MAADHKLKCVLLIDDDEITNFINKDLLSGMRVVEHIVICENGKEALDYLQKAYAEPSDPEFIAPDLIFLDLNMPVLDGFEFLKLYQERFDHRYSCKAIIMLTTSLRDEDIRRALDLKLLITDYIDKPLSEEKISNIIRQYFDVSFENT
jgi:CheY-like chemotaxis protein